MLVHRALAQYPQGVGAGSPVLDLFFFSSRRRHTRCLSDWSSDVCSSDLPDVGAAGKGKHVGNLVSLQPGETVRTMLAVRNLEEEGRFIFFATRNGTVKKTDRKSVV